MPDLVIEAHDLGKRYTLGQVADATTTVTEAFGAWRRRGARRGAAPELWALRGVSFEVHEGDVVGIVGHNGSGKSTLLKLLTRITDPTEGTARIRGRVGALLEVGTAFHGELTGRENIAINGVMLGMSRREVAARFDEIVEFADIAAFLDTPIKRYSSGMYLRLAFSVAAHLEPDVVVVDEVLAVGDAAFQRKCLGKMSELSGEGRTVLFVSHDSGAVSRLCNRALWMDHGRVRADGPVDDVLAEYLGHSLQDGHARALPADPGAPAVVERVSFTPAPGADADVITRSRPLRAVVELDVREALPGLQLAAWITDAAGARLLDEALDDDGAAHPLGRPGRYRVHLDVPPLLPAGDFVLGLWLGSPAGELMDQEVLRFTVHPRVGDPSEMATRRRSVSPAVTWAVEPA